MCNLVESTIKSIIDPATLFSRIQNRTFRRVVDKPETLYSYYIHIGYKLPINAHFVEILWPLF
jgi:hypothetical protein